MMMVIAEGGTWALPPKPLKLEYRSPRPWQALHQQLNRIDLLLSYRG
jgi:hypothetical protein